MERLL